MKRLLYIFLIPLFVHCGANKKEYVSKPARSLANPESDLLEIDAVVHHLNDSVSRVYFNILNDNLLYKRPDTSKAFYTELKVFCRLLSEIDSRKIIDSVSFYMYDRSVSEEIQRRRLLASTTLDVRTEKSYYLEIDVLDVNKKTRYTKGIGISKENRFSAQNFLVTHHDTVAFDNRFLKGDTVLIGYSNPGIRDLKADCFFKEFGPAPPPFSVKTPDEFKYMPDSVFNIRLEDKQCTLAMPQKGFFHLRASEKRNEGLTLFTEDSSFPGVSNSLEMIHCTRYIMFKEEFEKCRDAQDKKGAIDEFWLNIGGSQERARELLKRYYGRVKEANKNYSNYTQGWKSDRGMIYIVLGPPVNIYRSKNSEIWMYGNEANPNSLRFVFNKTENPFSENDFILVRSPFYKEAYHTAVEYWRQGLIYFENRK